MAKQMVVSDKDLIETLVADLKPVKVARFRTTFLAWLGLSFSFGSYFLHRVGTRTDLATALAEPHFAAGLVLFAVVFLLASWQCISGAFPDRALSSHRKMTLLLVGLCLSALIFYSGLLSGGMTRLQPFEPSEALGCCLRIALGSLVPSLAMVFLVARLSPLSIAKTVAYGMVASLTSISIVSQLNCPFDDVFHILIGHGLLLGGVGLVFFVGAAWLGKASHRLFVLSRATPASREQLRRLFG